MKITLKKLVASMLTFVMVLGMIPAVPIQAAENTHEGGTIAANEPVAPVYNGAVYDYIKSNNLLAPTGYIHVDTASGSVGPLFRADSYQGHTQSLAYNGGEGYNLVTSTKMRDRVTQWIMYSEPAWYENYVKDNPDVKMRLGGSLVNGASMSIATYADKSTALGTYKGQNGKTVTIPQDVPQGDVLNTTGVIENPWIALIDDTAPSIVKVEGGQSWLTVQFDEALRWANDRAGWQHGGSMGELTLTVKLSYQNSGSDCGTLTYQANDVDLETGVIHFTRISDAPAAGKYQIVEIVAATNGIKDEPFEVYGIKQCYRYSVGTNTERGTANYGKHIYKTPYVDNGIKMIGTLEDMAPLTDLAGNAVELPGDLDLRQYEIKFDNQAPVLEEVYLTGSMVDETCEVPKDQWPSDADLSSLYAGDGDQLYFNLKFNEDMAQRSDQTITLNVQKDGEAVVLENPTYIPDTNANSETCTVLRFGPFTVEEGMTGGQPIGIQAVNGVFDDYSYNDWTGEIPVCSQGIYLDAEAPEVKAELVGGKDENGKVNREPTILLTIDDGDGAGSLGLYGKIGLSAAAETVVDYEMAISDSMIPPADSEYDYTGKLGGGSVSWQSIPLYSNTRYLHIKLLGDANITLKDLKVEYQIPDWAGNVNVSDAAGVDYAIDEKAPTVTAPQISVSYGASSATIDTATWSGADYNQEDGLTAYYQWSDSEPADYSEGWVSAGNLNDNFQWELSVAEKYEDTITKTLWVYVEDASGNVSTMASSSCTLDLEKASTSFALESDPLIPTDDPDLMVRANGEQTAYTYATITFDDQKFVTKISSAEGTVDLFPIQRDVVNEIGAPLSAAEFNEILNAHYGEVTVSFESAFQDVTLSAGGDLSDLITDGSYSGDEGSVTFRYAPDVADVHTLSITGEGELDTAEESLLFHQTLRGQSVEVAIENDLQPDWGLSDVDFDKSYLTLNLDGEEVYKTNLAASETQTITLPDLHYETGAYTIEVRVTSRAGSVTKAELGTVLVVDNTQPTNVGVWEAYITPGLSLGYAPSVIQYDENGKPILSYGTRSPRYLYEDTAYVMEKNGDTDSGSYIEALTLNMSGQRETVRSDIYTAEVSGIQNFGFTVSVKDTEQTIEGHSVGGVKAVYVWNPELHAERENGFVTTEGTSWSYDSKNALEHDTWTHDAAGIGASTLNMTESGNYAMAEAIGLKPGTTVLYYQVVMDNGLESPVHQLQLYTTTETPSANLKMQVTEVKDTPDVENDIVRADVSLQNVFAANGLHATAWLAKEDATIDGVNYPAMSRYELIDVIKSGYYGSDYTDVSLGSSAAPTTSNVLSNPSFDYYRFLPIDTEDAGVVTLIDRGFETYSTQASNDSDTVTYKMDEYSAAGAFLLIDESGGTTMVFPQLIMEDDVGETVPAIEGYTPKYELVDKAVAFYLTPAITQNSTGTITASVKNTEYMDADKSTITFVYENGTEHTYPLLSGGAPNEDGFVSASLDDGISVSLSGPITTDAALAGSAYDAGVTVRMDLYDSNLDTVVTDWLKKYNSDYTETVSVNVKGLEYASATPSVTTGWYSTGGVRLWWDNPVNLDGETGYSQQWLLPIFKNGTYSVSFTDAFGNRFENISFDVTGYDGPDVTIDNLNNTSQPVTVDVTIPEGAAYSEVYVTADTSTTVISGNGTAAVTAKVAESTMLTITWNNQSKKVGVTNVYPAEPAVIWSYGETADEYVSGDVTAYVVDANGNWDLIDPLTGETPQYTFKVNGGVTEYTFPSLSTGELLADGTPVDLGSFTAELEVDLVEPEQPAAPEGDNRAPSVQVTPYAMQNGLVVSLPMALTLADDGAYEDLTAANPALAPYDETEITRFEDSADFTEALGWASLFRFQIEVQDLSETRIFVKNGLYAEEPASYDGAQSEEIANVKLSGSTLEVFGSAQFTLFVMDAAGNCVTIPMDVYNVGAAPVPTYTKVLTTTSAGDNAVEIQLTAPDGVSELKVTGVNGTAADKAILTANGTYTVDYSCTYQGQTVTGQLQVTVNEIDNIPPTLLQTKWSANKVTATNQDVTVTLTFDKNVSRVQSDPTPDTVKVLLSGSTATVRYSDNTEALTLYFQGANGKWVKEAIKLDAVTNIDRTAPQITVSAPEVSANGKKAVITFTADERVSFREASRVGKTFTRTIKENGTYTFTFADMVGNVTTETVTVTQLVTEPLTMQFSRNANGSGAAQSPEALGALHIGDTFYVSLNRAATVDFNRQKIEYTSGWTALTMGDKSGGVIGATDVYGNTASAVFSNILYPDTTAPTIAITLYTIHVSKDITNADLEEKLLANAEAVDDRAGEVTVTVTMPDRIAAGDYPVTYTAEDAFGNRASIPGMLTIHDGTVPSVWVDGEFVERERIYLAEHDDTLMLKVDMQGQPYTVSYKKNIKTVAQMKRGATELELTDHAVQLPFSGTTGYYTVCITTQDHDQYRIVIYVK